jgi:uncharacterized membrane protein
MKAIAKKLLVRIQNPKVIVAVVSGLLLILTNTGVITIEHADHVSQVLDTVLTLLVTMGVFGNPESHVFSTEVGPGVEVPKPNALPDGAASPIAPPQFYDGSVQ